MSLRLTSETWEKLEQIAYEVKRKTGFRVSYNVLLASMIDAEHTKLGGRRKQLKALWGKGKESAKK